MAALPTIAWSCQTKALPKPGAPAPIEGAPLALTVGDKFQLECLAPALSAPGSAATTFDQSKIRIQEPEGLEHSLRILSIDQISDHRAVFTATTYRVGDLKLKDFVLTDGASAVRLEGLQLQVKSVIDPKENPEKKPFGPFAPMKLAYPGYLWLALALALILIAAFAAQIVRRRIRKSQLAKALASQPIAGHPYSHFNKEMRQLQRAYQTDSVESRRSQEKGHDYVASLDRSLRWYLARALIIPVLDGAPAQASSALRRAHKNLARALDAKILRALSELSRALGSKARLTATDCQQLADLCRKTADSVDQALRTRDSESPSRKQAGR